MINLNRDTVFLDTFPFGKTQNIECRLGRKAYLLDVEKKQCFRIHYLLPEIKF